MSSDDAVSPVVSVILLVAIVVVLSTVVFSFVGGIGNEQTSSSAGITVESNESSVKMNVIDMGTSEQIEFTNGTETKTVSSVGESVVFNGTDPVQVVGQNGQSSSLIRTVKPTDEGVVNNPTTPEPEQSPLQLSEVSYYTAQQIKASDAHIYLNSFSSVSKISRSTGNTEWTGDSQIGLPRDDRNNQGIKLTDSGTLYSGNNSEVARYDSNGDKTEVPIPDVGLKRITSDEKLFGFNQSRQEVVVYDLVSENTEKNITIEGQAVNMKESGNFIYVQSDEIGSTDTVRVYKISTDTLNIQSSYSKEGYTSFRQGFNRPKGVFAVENGKILMSLKSSNVDISETTPYSLASISTSGMSEEWVNDNFNRTYADISIATDGTVYGAGTVYNNTDGKRGFYNATFVKLNGGNGQVESEFIIPEEFAGESSPIDVITGAVEVRGNTLYTATYEGTVRAIDTDGMDTVLWTETKNSGVNEVLVLDEDIYIGTPSYSPPS